MKKGLWTKITAVALSLALFTLAGCSKEEPEKEPEIQEPERIEVIHPLNSTAYCESYYVGNESSWENAMKKEGFTGLEVIYQSPDGNGYVVTADCKGAYEEMVNTFVLYASEGSVYIEKASEYSILEKFEVFHLSIDDNATTYSYNKNRVDKGWQELLGENYQIISCDALPTAIAEIVKKNGNISGYVIPETNAADTSKQFKYTDEGFITW